MSRQTRRTFLKKTAAASAGLAAGLTIAGTKASGQVLGANSTIRVGVAGIHGRGRSHIGEFSGKNGAQVTHLIDPDSSLFKGRQQSVKSSGGNTPKCFRDIRKALEDKNLDAVTVASCNHWHSLITIWSCMAGKDVYVEKPCSHNPFEGRKCVEAARNNKCIVQHGTQSRSSKDWHKRIAAAASGKYGKLLISYGYASKPRGILIPAFAEPKEPPKELDFDLWLGPAKKQPYHENLVHYNWHWFWDFGNGEIGNQGVHQMDIARWAVTACTGLKGPQSVISMGGRYGYKDQAQTPNTQLSIFNFGECKLFFEDYGLARGKNKHCDNAFFLEEGVIKGNQFYPNGKEKGEPLVEAEINCYPGDHFANFANCVRSRKQEELNADILEGHLSATLCHLANASYRLGESAPLSKTPEVLAGKGSGSDADKDAVEAFQEMKAHLARRTEMNLEESEYRLGRKLTYDPATEKFVGDDEANKLLTRPYRHPYVVPEQV